MLLSLGSFTSASLRAGGNDLPAPLEVSLSVDPPGASALRDPRLRGLGSDLVALERTAPNMPTPAWLQAAVRECSALVRACGSVEAADHVHKALWAEEAGPSLSAAHMDVFEPLLSAGHLYWYRVVAARGADLQIRGIRRRRTCREPLADESQRELLWQGVWGDFIEGRAFLLAGEDAQLSVAPDGWSIPRQD